MFQRIAGILVVSVLLVASTNAQTNNQIQSITPVANDPKVCGKPTRDPVKGRIFGQLTEDITANGVRGGLAWSLTDVVESPETNSLLNRADVHIESMRQSANCGYIADHIIGDLAGRGIAREGKNKEGRVIDGPPMITNRLIDAAYADPMPSELALPKKPMPITKPRVVVGGFADALMNMDQWLKDDAGNPMTLKAKVEASRAKKSDIVVERAVAACMMNKDTVAVSVEGKNVGVALDVPECATLGGSMALRHAYDTGLRYTGRHMTTAPQNAADFKSKLTSAHRAQ